MRTPIVAGNWKMNTSLDEASHLVRDLLAAPNVTGDVEKVVIPPFPWIVPLSDLLRASDWVLGAQDCATEDKGAYTGEVSAAMLHPYCRYVVVGHSERRHILNESDDLVAAKLRAALRNGLRPILCVGELLEERAAGEARSVVERQLRSALADLGRSEFESLVVAYEPVWAIGTGKAATPSDAAEMAGFIRRLVGELAGEDVAARLRIQYGGSVSAENAAGFLRLDDIDGALVGGASLKADQFLSIVGAVG